MNKKYKTISIMSLLIFSFWAIGNTNSVPASSQYDFSGGDLSGAIRADLSNINYTNLGLSAMSLNSLNQHQGSIDRMIVRTAFSIQAAVILMDAYDQMLFDWTGQEVFTGVYGARFTSANYLDYENYFNWEEQLANGQSIGLNSYAGDAEGDIGSNGTLGEHSYRAEIDYKHFNTADYKAINKTEVENLNTAYSDLTDLLLETNEDEDEFKQEASDIVVAGLDNIESAIQEVMRKRISQIIDIPSSQIRIDNYTLTDAWQEQVMSEGLANNIRESYDDAKSAGFLSSFQVSSPLKFSKVSVGQKWDSFKDNVGGLGSKTTKTFDAIRGSTFVTSTLAFKDRIVKGTVSTFTGLKEKAKVGFSKVTDLLSKIKTGTKKLLAKPMAWFNGLSTKFKKVIKIVAVILIIAVVLYIAFQIWARKAAMNRR